MDDYNIIYPEDPIKESQEQSSPVSKRQSSLKNAAWVVGVSSALAYFNTPQFHDSDSIAFKFLGPLTVGVGTYIGGVLFAKGTGHFLKPDQSLGQMTSDIKDTTEYFKTVHPDPNVKSIIVPNDIYTKTMRMPQDGCRGCFGSIGVFAAGITGMVMGYNITKTQVLKHEEIYTGEPKTKEVITENTQDVTQRTKTLHFDDAIKAMTNAPGF